MNYLLCVKRKTWFGEEFNTTGCVGVVDHCILTRSQWNLEDDEPKNETLTLIIEMNLISLLTLAFWAILTVLLNLTFA